MTIKYSKQEIFWNVNDNVPSKVAFEKYKSKMLLDNNNTLKVNFKNYNEVEVVARDKDIKYIWVNHNNVDYFYYVNSISKVLSGGYVLNCSLDIYTTYMIKFIEDMKTNNQEVEIIRSHKFDDKSGQFDDEQLQNAFIEYDSIQSNNYIYNKQEVGPDKYWYNEDLIIKNPDFNANKYYVFSEGENGNYTFIPVIKRNEKVTIFRKQPTPDATPSETFIYLPNTFGAFSWNGDNRFVRCKDINGRTYSQIEIDEKIRNAYATGKKVVYQLRNQRKELQNMEFWFDNLYNFNEINTPYTWYSIKSGTGSKLPSSFSFKNWNHYDGRVGRDDYATPLLDNIEIKDTLQGYNRGSSFFQQFDDKSKRLGSILSMCMIKILIYDVNSKFSQPEEVDNYRSVLESMKFSQQYSNKFVGLFYLPNILSVDSNINVKKFEFSPRPNSAVEPHNLLVLNLDAEGINIRNFPIFQWSYDKRWWLLNNSNITSKNILKFVGVNYYNNIIDPSVRSSSFYEGGNTLYLGGYFFFTSNGILISKPPLLSLQNSIINFPYQLPSGTDDYINYVNATKNSADTSYNITKQNAIKDATFGAVSGVTQILGGVGKIMNPLNIINPAGMLGGIGQAIQGGTNIAKSITDGVMGVVQKEQQMRAKYADKNNQLGNQLAPANAIDAMWSVYNNSIEQFEMVEVKNLTEHSLKSLNNIITLYGEFYPRIENINNVWNVEGVEQSKYRYLSLSSSYLDKIYYRYGANIPLEYRETIISLLGNGLRFWDVEHPFFNDWEGDVPTSPDNPNNQGEVIPKPPVNVQEVVIPADIKFIFPSSASIQSGSVSNDIVYFMSSFHEESFTLQYEYHNGTIAEIRTNYKKPQNAYLNKLVIDVNNVPFKFINTPHRYYAFCLSYSNGITAYFNDNLIIELKNVREQDVQIFKSKNFVKGWDKYNGGQEFNQLHGQFIVNGEVLWPKS